MLDSRQQHSIITCSPNLVYRSAASDYRTYLELLKPKKKIDHFLFHFYIPHPYRRNIPALKTLLLPSTSAHPSPILNHDADPRLLKLVNALFNTNYESFSSDKFRDGYLSRQFDVRLRIHACLFYSRPKQKWKGVATIQCIV